MTHSIYIAITQSTVHLFTITIHNSQIFIIIGIGFGILFLSLTVWKRDSAIVSNLKRSWVSKRNIFWVFLNMKSYHLRVNWLYVRVWLFFNKNITNTFLKKNRGNGLSEFWILTRISRVRIQLLALKFSLTGSFLHFTVR